MIFFSWVALASVSCGAKYTTNGNQLLITTVFTHIYPLWFDWPEYCLTGIVIGASVAPAEFGRVPFSLLDDTLSTTPTTPSPLTKSTSTKFRSEGPDLREHREEGFDLVLLFLTDSRLLLLG